MFSVGSMVAFWSTAFVGISRTQSERGTSSLWKRATGKSGPLTEDQFLLPVGQEVNQGREEQAISKKSWSPPRVPQPKGSHLKDAPMTMPKSVFQKVARTIASAQAHPGHDSSSFAGGLVHPVLGMDHLLAMIAVGLWRCNSAAVHVAGPRAP